MKKAFILFTIILAIVVSSCKKDDNSLTPNKLAGTTWLYTEGNGSKREIRLKFISESQLSFHYQGSYSPRNAEGLYKINGTSFTADIVYTDGAPETIDGIFEGNTLNIQFFNQICALKKQ